MGTMRVVEPYERDNGNTGRGVHEIQREFTVKGSLERGVMK